MPSDVSIDDAYATLRERLAADEDLARAELTPKPRAPSKPHKRRYELAPQPAPLSLVDAQIALEPMPCDDCCRISECRAAQVACQAFRVFVKYGDTEDRWGREPREPSAEIYLKVFRRRDSAPSDLGE